jgi:hypothetical protein
VRNVPLILDVVIEKNGGVRGELAMM